MLYHISVEDLHEKVLNPRVPKNTTVDEDAVTERVCLSTTVEGCLKALSNDSIKYGTVYNVYRPTSRCPVVFPTTGQVPDVYLTGEVWVLRPVKLHKIAELTVYERIDSCPSNNYLLDGKLIEVMTYNFYLRYIENEDCIALKL